MTSTAKVGPKLQLEIIDDTLLQIALEMIRQGCPVTVASVNAGFSQRSFTRWLAKGREDEAIEPYRSFAARVDEALSEWHWSRVQSLNAKAEKSGDWRADAWMLERRFPSVYADKSKSLTINLGVILQSPEWHRLREGLLEALASHPEALEDALKVMGGGDVVDGEIVGELEAA